MNRPPGTLILLSLAVAMGMSACVQNVAQEHSPSAKPSAFEAALFTEMNRARTDPAAYAASLEEIKKRFDARLPPLSAANPALADAAMNPFYEAIAFLTTAPPLPAFTLSPSMSAAARDHLTDQLQAANLGHVGRDGSTPAARLERYGAWEVGLGESIVHGSATAQRLGIQLVVDADDPQRHQRLNLFNPAFAVTGIACDSNERYRNLCVITFAGGYTEQPTKSTR